MHDDNPRRLDDLKSTDLEGLLEELANAPGDVDLLIELGRRHLRLGDLDSAEAYYRRALDLDADDPVVNLHVGNLFYARGRHRLAVEHFRIAAELAPEQACPYWCIANAHEALGDSVRAEAYYQEAVSVDPTDCMARRELEAWYERRYAID